MPLKVEEAGIVTWKANEGAALSPGDLLASLALDNPENVAATTIFAGNLRIEGWIAPATVSRMGLSHKSTSRDSMLLVALMAGGRPHLVLRKTLEELNSCISGYSIFDREEIDTLMEDIGTAVTDSTLPKLEIDEQLSVLSGRIPATLFANITTLITNFQQDGSNERQQEIRYVLLLYTVIDLILDFFLLEAPPPLSFFCSIN